MKKYTLLAPGVPIIRFSRYPDSTGLILPPECYITFPERITVRYGKHAAGSAILTRIGNEILANLALKASAKDVDMALRRIRKLYPATVLTITEAVDNLIFKASIIEVFLTTYCNDDLTIEPLGDKVYLRRKPEELN